jgi:hypothetical protein
LRRESGGAAGGMGEEEQGEGVKGMRRESRRKEEGEKGG